MPIYPQTRHRRSESHAPREEHVRSECWRDVSLSVHSPEIGHRTVARSYEAGFGLPSIEDIDIDSLSSTIHVVVLAIV